MDSIVAAVIFAGVWLALSLLYCVFKIFGGKIVDICSCDCFDGPCCNCWGVGGEVDKYDFDHPLRGHGLYGRGGAFPRRPQLPPIVVVNKMASDSDSDSSSGSDQERERGRGTEKLGEQPKRNGVVRDAQARSEAPSALLLRSQAKGITPNEQPLFV
jgi:hypothetical protein